MVKITDECCDCGASPCLGDNCPNKSIKRFWCDNCSEEVDKLYYGFFGRELCAECALDELEVVE